MEILGDDFTYRALEPTTSATQQSTKPPKQTSTITRSTTVTTYSTRARTCDGSKYPQPCLHYSSVIAHNPQSQWNLLTCKNIPKNAEKRPLPRLWDRQHKNKEWMHYIASSYRNPKGSLTDLGATKPAKGCQRDEWPPALFMQGEKRGYIRFLPGDQNGGVANDGGSGWNGFCEFAPRSSVAPPQGGRIVNGVVEVVVTTSITLNVMSYTWTNVPIMFPDVQGLSANPCRPSVLTADVGYALFTDDPWYGVVRLNDYNNSPGQKTIGVNQPLLRRDGQVLGSLDYVDGKMVVDNGNSSRPASDEELKELGYKVCEMPDCEAELGDLRQLQAELNLPTQAPTAVSAFSTVSTTAAELKATITHQQPGSKPMVEASQPTMVKATGYSRRQHSHHNHRHGH